MAYKKFYRKADEHLNGKIERCVEKGGCSSSGLRAAGCISQ